MKQSHLKASEQLFILLQESRVILSLNYEEEKNLLSKEFFKRYSTS